MQKKITENIAITVRPKFEDSRKIDHQNCYFFSYFIRIENLGEFSVHLLKRQWYIFDAKAHYSEVKGDGVLGKQPIIMPGEVYSYQSFCRLESEMGMMWGHYLMQGDDGKMIQVKIPEFQLIVPYRLN